MAEMMAEDIRDLMKDDEENELLKLLKERLELYREEQVKYTEQANRVMAAYNGSISALEEVIDLYLDPPSDEDEGDRTE